MMSLNSERFAVSDRTAALVLASMLLLGSGRTARAQVEDPGSRNRLEGTWHLVVTVRDCQTGQEMRHFPALAAFSKGGTLAVTTTGQSPSLSTTGLGVWRHTEGQSYSAVFETFVFSPAGVWIQKHRITRVIDIVDDGDTFMDTVALEIFDADDNLIVRGCGTSVANRFK